MEGHLTPACRARLAAPQSEEHHSAPGTADPRLAPDVTPLASPTRADSFVIPSAASPPAPARIALRTRSIV